MVERARCRPMSVLLMAVTDPWSAAFIPAYCKGPSRREVITAGSPCLSVTDNSCEDQEAEKGMLALSWPPFLFSTQI